MINGCTKRVQRPFDYNMYSCMVVLSQAQDKQGETIILMISHDRAGQGLG